MPCELRFDDQSKGQSANTVSWLTMIKQQTRWSKDGTTHLRPSITELDCRPLLC